MKRFSLVLFLLLVVLCFYGCGPKEPKNVAIGDVKFSEAKDGPAVIENIFKEKTTIYLSFEITNFTRHKDGTVWVQEDLRLFGPDNKIVEWITPEGAKKFDYENLVDINKKFEKKVTVIPTINTISLPPGAALGEYKAQIEVRDKIGQTKANKELILKIIKTKESKT